MDNCEITIVIPAYNEEQVIAGVVEELLELKYKVIVVNDSSTDNTEQVLKKYELVLINHPINLGQGAALQTGFEYAIKNQLKYVVTFDSDGQHSKDDIPKLVEQLKNFDVALGTRFSRGGEATNIPNNRRILLKIATFYTRLNTGLDLTDTHNGIRAFRLEALKKIKITQNRMGHASQILNLISEHKLSFTEVPVKIKYTEYSMTKGQKMRNAFNIIWESIFEGVR